MKKTILVALVVLASASFATLNAKEKKDKKKEVPQVENKVELKTAKDSLSYISGMALTNGLKPFLMQNYGVGEEEMPAVVEGFKAAVKERKNPKSKAFHAGEQVADMVIERMLPGLQKEFTIGKDSLNEDVLFEGFIASLNNDSTYYNTEKAEKLFAEQRKAYKDRADSINKQKGEAFLAENKTKEGVCVLPSGLQYKILKKGTGVVPKLTDKVQVVYEGKTIDGKVFDATSKHGGEKYDTFTPGNLIKGWQEALTMMPVGSKWELFIPYDLAYGAQGAGRDIAPYSTLIFTMELQGIEPAKEATDADNKTKEKTAAPKVKKPVKAKTSAKKH